MSYATQAQIQMAAGGPERFDSLFDWNGDGNPDPDVITEAQARGDGEIDGYLRMRYATPIANPSDTLIRLAADNAVYWCRRARGMLAGDPQDLEHRKEWIAQLEAMRDGKLRPDEGLPAKSTAVKSHVVPLGGDITRDGTKGMW